MLTDLLPMHPFSFKRQRHKMVKYTQTIRRQIADKLFEGVWPFCEVGAKRVKTNLHQLILVISTEVTSTGIGTPKYHKVYAIETGKQMKYYLKKKKNTVMVISKFIWAPIRKDRLRTLSISTIRIYCVMFRIILSLFIFLNTQ